MKKICLFCKKEFITDKSNRKYCSRKCFGKSTRNQVEVVCDTCEKTIIKYPSCINPHNFCSRQCSGKFKIGKSSPNKGKHITNSTSFKKGKDHPLWKGGKRKKPDRKGFYMQILNPSHPNCDVMGYVSEHRFVMEKHIGRFLFPEEIVHHINGKKNDNRIENLALLATTSAHTKLHAQLRKSCAKR